MDKTDLTRGRSQILPDRSNEKVCQGLPEVSRIKNETSIDKTGQLYPIIGQALPKESQIMLCSVLRGCAGLYMSTTHSQCIFILFYFCFLFFFAGQGFKFILPLNSCREKES